MDVIGPLGMGLSSGSVMEVLVIPAAASIFLTFIIRNKRSMDPWGEHLVLCLAFLSYEQIRCNQTLLIRPNSADTT